MITQFIYLFEFLFFIELIRSIIARIKLPEILCDCIELGLTPDPEGLAKSKVAYGVANDALEFVLEYGRFMRCELVEIMLT